MPVDYFSNALFPLTPREMEILERLSKGLDPKAIAKELDIKYDTVRSHLKNIYKKLHVSSMIEAVARAKDKGLIQSGY